MYIKFIIEYLNGLFIHFKKYSWKIKIIIILIYFFNNKYFKLTTIKNNIKLDELNFYLNKFDLLIKKPKNITDSILLEEKRKIINLLLKNQNLTLFDTIFFNTECCFGNCIAFLNKLIFYCEIIGCKYLVLNKDFFWFIKNNITINNYNITIFVDDYKKYDNTNTLIYNSWDIFSSF